MNVFFLNNQTIKKLIRRVLVDFICFGNQDKILYRIIEITNQ